jgi:hypothetical protein
MSEKVVESLTKWILFKYKGHRVLHQQFNNYRCKLLHACVLLSRKNTIILLRFILYPAVKILIELTWNYWTELTNYWIKFNKIVFSNCMKQLLLKNCSVISCVATPSVCILLKLTFPASFVCKKTAKVILLMIPFVPCFAGRTSAYFCLCSKLDIDHTYKETPSILQDPNNSLYIGRKIRHLLIRNGKSPHQCS